MKQFVRWGFWFFWRFFVTLLCLMIFQVLIFRETGHYMDFVSLLIGSIIVIVGVVIWSFPPAKDK